MCKNNWWKEQPLIISAVQTTQGDSNWTLDEFVAKNGFNTEQLLHLYGGGYITTFFPERDGENLTQYLKKSRKHGIREIMYVNTHVLGKEVSAKNPTWQQITKDGTPKVMYQIYSGVCVNPAGDFHKDFLKKLEVLCQFDIDGIFMDGPVMFSTGCYCDTCQATFEKKYGHSIYEATRLELQEMAVDNCTQHLKEVSERIKSINPNIMVYINNSALRSDITGSNTRKIYDYVDMLGAEGGFHGAWMGPTGLWHLSARVKHLEGIVGDTLKGEKPIITFFSANHSGISNYPHTPAEVELAYAQAYGNGSNIWFGPHYPAEEYSKTEAALKLKEMNAFINGNKDIFAPSKTCARVAVMWSQQTSNNYASSVGDSDYVAGQKSGFKERGDHYEAIFSVCDMLFRNHIQFDIIDEESVLDGTINNYQSVIMPTVACVSDEVAEKIAEYVENGGNILGNFDIATYNEDGSFAGASKLSNVFGFVGAPQILKGAIMSATYYFQKNNDELINDISVPKFPGPILNAKWELEQDVEVIMNATYPKESQYEFISFDKNYPAIFKHKYGKGTAYYISGAYAEFVANVRNIKDYEKIIKKYCENTADSVVVTDAAGLYEVVLRRQQDRYILHVINLTGAMERPLERIVPLYNVEFSLNLEGFPVEKDKFELKSIRGANIENIKVDGSQISFTLDKLNSYEIITIE